MNEMIIFAVLLAVLPTYQLSWHPVPRATSYALEKQAVLTPEIWTNDTLCSEAYPCSTRTYSPATGIIEQVRVRAINAYTSTPSVNAWTLLTLDWSNGVSNYSTYEGNGAMGCTSVKVMLPSPRWTVVYSYQGAIPVYVKASPSFDYNGDGVVNLSDFVVFGTWWVAHGKPLNELANFGSDYRTRTREW